MVSPLINLLSSEARNTNVPTKSLGYMSSWMQRCCLSICLTSADIVIEPELGYINLADFNKVPEILDVGRQATEAVIPEIRRKLAEV